MPEETQNQTPAPKPAPAAPAAKPPAAPAYLPWESELGSRLKHQYGAGVQPLTYAGQNFFVVDRAIAHGILRLMCEEGFDYLVDVTCVHYPQRELAFEIVWILYSFPKNERVRVKTSVADGEEIPTVTDLWRTANWLEREAYDMFGVKFTGHPDLRRILLPEEWGFPLRKDHDILKQDTSWVQKNLGIESGQ
jgi:NADH-quinone oxidoreductase subunit C